MPKGILYVESRPASPEQAEAYHRWYDETHIPEILALDGFVSGRRFGSLDADGSFIAVYEIDTDIATARAALAAAGKAGSMSAPTGVQLDPPPSVRYFLDVTDLEP
jgi:hypothetical protein